MTIHPEKPILGEEPDIYPSNFLESPGEDEERWWAHLYPFQTGKALNAKLRKLEIGHYSPVIQRRYKSEAGRIRTSYLPLFSNYVFLRGNEEDRYQAVSTGCVSQCLEVLESDQLYHDLCQIQRLIGTGAALSPEERLDEGDWVRVKSGPFAGYEGQVGQRDGQQRLIVAVRFMNQGASVALDDCQLEKISSPAK